MRIDSVLSYTIRIEISIHTDYFLKIALFEYKQCEYTKVSCQESMLLMMKCSYDLIKTTELSNN